MSATPPPAPTTRQIVQPKWYGPWWVKALFAILLLGGTGWTVYFNFTKDFPLIISLADYRPLLATRIYVRDGDGERLLGEFFKEKREVVPYEKIPPMLVRAFIAAEDDKFFEHRGISLTAIVRAAIANFRAGQVVQGGSTITQQVAKSLFLSPERNLIRKLKEVILAYRIEENLKKEEILYLYLNQIYLGHGAYGVAAAVQAYFHKSLSQVTLAEAAFLAGMPRAPTKYGPFNNPKRAKERQLYVLRRMVENGYSTAEEMQAASAKPLKVFRSSQEDQEFGQYLLEHVRRYLVEKYGERRVYEEGLTVHLMARYKDLVKARVSMREGLREIDKMMGYRGARKKLNGKEEIKAFLDESDRELARQRVQFGFLRPDGEMGFTEAAESMGIKSAVDYLKDWEFYEAVVTSVNDAKKLATVQVGSAELPLPLENMNWAYPYNEKKQMGAPPTRISQVLMVGDVVLIRVKPQPKSEHGMRVVAALEQEPKVEGALFSIQPNTGYVAAMEGGYDFGRSEFNRAIQAKRQPGSAFKPIIYSAAIEKGLTPSSIIVDAPVVYDDEAFGKWKPTNFEEKFYGDTPLLQAFIRSRNIPTIKLVQQLEVHRLIEFARNLGMVTSQFNQDLSIALGSASTSLYELTHTFTIFPRYGNKLDHPIFVKKVVDRDGTVLEDNIPDPLPTLDQMQQAMNPPTDAGAAQAQSADPSVPVNPIPMASDSKQVMDPKVAYVMINMMKEVVQLGTGMKAKALGRPAAGKTGTTNDYRDAWFMGYTPENVTGVWVGYDEQEGLGAAGTGAGAALPIWLNYMKGSLADVPVSDFAVPQGIVFVTIDPETGQLVDPNVFPQARPEAFIAGTEPTQLRNRGDGKRMDSDSEFLKEDFQ